MRKKYYLKNPKNEIFICLCLHYKVPNTQDFSFSFFGTTFAFQKWKPDQLPNYIRIRKLINSADIMEKKRDVMTKETLNLNFFFVGLSVLATPSLTHVANLYF
jgi:hypothetical protein